MHAHVQMDLPTHQAHANGISLFFDAHMLFDALFGGALQQLKGSLIQFCGDEQLL